MSNKLQELTDRLYNEGLSKGKEEGEILLFKARKEADEIIANARKQAEDIVTEAENRAAQLKEKAESDIKMASEQALMATKKDIENLLVNALCAEETEKVLSEEKFLKEMTSGLLTGQRNRLHLFWTSLLISCVFMPSKNWTIFWKSPVFCIPFIMV